MRKNCKQCKGPIPEARQKRKAKFCKEECTKAYKRALYARENAALKTNLPTGTVGAIAELVVAVDLMDRGYEVFRALSQSCSCDLAVLMNGVLVRIEVRSGYVRNANTKILFSKPEIDKGRFDIYAVVLHSDPRKIIYLDPDSNEIEITTWNPA